MVVNEKDHGEDSAMAKIIDEELDKYGPLPTQDIKS